MDNDGKWTQPRQARFVQDKRREVVPWRPLPVRTLRNVLKVQSLVATSSVPLFLPR